MVKLIDVVIETRNEDFAAEAVLAAASLKAKQEEERKEREIRDYAKQVVRATDVTNALAENIAILAARIDQAMKSSSELLSSNSDLTLEATKFCSDLHEEVFDDFADLARAFLTEHYGDSFDEDAGCDCEECANVAPEVTEAQKDAATLAESFAAAPAAFVQIKGSSDSAAVGVVIANIMAAIAAGKQAELEADPCDCALCQHIAESNRAA